MAKSKKPYKGKIYCWRIVQIPHRKKLEKFYGESLGLGYYICGYTTRHPHMDTYLRTSWVVRHLPSGWIKTRNSRYKLVGKEQL